MASWVFSSIQSLSTKVLEAVRGTTSQPQDPASSTANQSVREDLEKLSRMLARIQAVLQDAEEREIRDRSVRLWLQELRGVAYQAEDLLDEFHYEVLRSIVERGDAAIESYHRENGIKRKYSEMCSSSSLASYSSTITRVSIPDTMAEKIKGITERFEEISKARRDLHLREEDGTRLVTHPEIRPPTSSHVDERAIFGRNEEKRKIISLLNPSSGPDFMVLPIIGMGGVGKTTLAQLVYNDSTIRMLFNKRCWVYVSEDFDLVRLTKAIVDSVSDSPCEYSELSILQDVLKEKIRGLCLFLVLDDMWNEKRNLWECFKAGFLGAKIIRILMTTRNISVAKITQTTLPFQLGSLPEENCWLLFKHFAFGSRETSENENLDKIGCGIVRKCNGSPLAIKVLGGILRYETNEEKWREILESDISEIDENGQIMPALCLSYQKLPLHLRPCFLYLSMFPKGTAFEKDMVVRLWMAQGYMNGNTRNSKTWEEMGSERFDELQGRSLIDYWQFGNYFFLHDLIHDLARSISQDAFQPSIENYQHRDSSCIVQHLCLTRRDEFLGLSPRNYWYSRTFVYECLGSHNFDFAILHELACVRALQLRYSILPNTLGALKHLRYLTVGGSKMKVLPETLCRLYNLQTLDLDCFFLQELPQNIKNLINLRYFQLRSGKIQQLPESIFLLHSLHTLLLKDCAKLKDLPRGIEHLTRLRMIDLPKSLINIPFGIGKLTTLKPLCGYFSVNDHGIIGGLGELKDMNKLSGFLHISGLKNISDVEISRSSNLASKPNLRKLILSFQNCQPHTNEGLHLAVRSSNDTKNKKDERMQELVLEALQPHGNLKELQILHYRGRKSPSWLLNSLLPKLTVVTLKFCVEPDFLPPFSQLRYLRILKISGSTNVRNVGDELNTYSLSAGYGSFKQPQKVGYPSLQELSLSNMLNLVEWQMHDGDFPSLKKLTIENCTKLWKITKIPQEVREMLIKDCGCHELQLSCESKIQSVFISDCPNLISVHSTGTDLPALEKITVCYCPRLCKFANIQKLPAVRNISLYCCPELRLFSTIPEELDMLNIQMCGFREIIVPSQCVEVFISECLELTLVNWRNEDLNNIVKVIIEYCPKLKFLTIPARIVELRIYKSGFQEIVFQSSMENPVVENLTISSCQELISINWSNGGSIGEFTFEYCQQFKFPALPSVIKKLNIHMCGFQEVMLPSKSEKLVISDCPKLISINLMEGHLNSIEEVTVERCPKLTLPIISTGMKKLKMSYCGIQEINFPNRSKIEMVEVTYCPLLTAINWVEQDTLNGSNHFQKGLKDLRVSHCPFLQSPIIGVLHSNTKSAEIYNCPRMDLGKRYVYQRDGMVKRLSAFGNKDIHLSSHALDNCIVPIQENLFTLSFRKEDSPEESLPWSPLTGMCQSIMLILPSLVTLEIWRCRTVLSIGGLDNLSNLNRLSISGCPELCNWNDSMLPLSLEFLELASCQKLTSMPLLSVANQSSTLKAVVIIECPLLDVIEGSCGLMNLETLEILHCKNVNISPATESIKFRPHFTISDYPQTSDWCRRKSITSVQGQVKSYDTSQDDTEAEQCSAVRTSDN